MISIGRFDFEAPVYNKAALKNLPGVYAVLDDRVSNRLIILDIGESEDVRDRIENHDREGCWLLNRRGRICYAAYYMPGSSRQQREAVEEELRHLLVPPCGVR